MRGRSRARSAEAPAGELAPAPRARFVLPRAQRGVLAEAERELALEHVRTLLETPTAPYAEDHMLAAVRRVAASIGGLELRADEHQNLIVRWPGRGRAPRHGTLAFSAHLDHPGFLYHGRQGGRRGGKHVLEFHGGVPVAYLKDAPVRLFELASGRACATARVAAVETRGDLVLCTLADVRGRPHARSFGMFDLTPGAVRGRRLHARVCDDLMGAAAILTALALHARARHPAPLVGLFTRAEETGFVGCLGLVRSRALPRDLAVVGLECSPKRASARVGLGPVVRVGDRLTTFQPWITERLQEAVDELRAAHPDFRSQRALMDGGSCESTAYNHAGVPAGALCLALGNYHNCGPRGRIAPEYVDWDDHEGLVALLVASAARWSESPGRKMTLRLNRIWQREYKRLAASARRIAGRSQPTSRRAP